MSKSKKAVDNKTYSFTIDSQDAKYKRLIDFLEEIDSGARSFIIRQILNSYVNSQTGMPLFGFGSEKTFSPEPTSSRPSGQQTDSETNAMSSDTALKPVQPPSFEEEKVKPKKPLPPELQGLKNTFN